MSRHRIQITALMTCFIAALWGIWFFEIEAVHQYAFKFAEATRDAALDHMLSPSCPPCHYKTNKKSKIQDYKPITYISDDQLSQMKWFQKLIPPELRDFFNLTAKDRGTKFRRTLFTETMMRRSRAHIGNTQRLHEALHKGLVRRTCLNIVVSGASVTLGTNVGFDNTYHQALKLWLNTKYPCTNESGQPSQHTVTVIGLGGTTTCAFFYNLMNDAVLTKISQADIYIHEYHVNDYFESEDKFFKFQYVYPNKKHSGSKFETTQFCVEGVIRRILDIKVPNKTAVLWLIADVRDDKFYSRTVKFPETENHGIEQFTYYPLIWWYGIPMVSVADPYFQLGMYNLSDTHGRNSISQFHTDDCCHPWISGHRLVAMMIAYNFDMEVDRWLEVLRHEEEQDFSTLKLPYPFRMTAEQSSVYDRIKATTTIDFTEPKNPPDLEDQSIFRHVDSSWTWYNDSPDQEKIKFGLISKTPYSRVSVAFNVPGKVGTVSVAYMKTYEKISSAVACLTSADFTSGDDFCELVVKEKPELKHTGTIVATHFLSGKWSQSASTFTLHNMVNVEQGDYLLHLCVVPDGTDTKFKLLKVFVLGVPS